MAQLNQNLTDVDENDAGGSWRALPPGEYVCEITESDYKQTRSGNGMVLKLTFSVLKEGFQGQIFFDNLTLEHSNPKTVEIGRAWLKQLAIGCGLPNPDRVESSEDLHGLPVLVKLNRVLDRDFGDETGHRNRVMAYTPVSQRKQVEGAGKREESPPHTDAVF